MIDGADLLLGEWAKSLRIELFHADASLLLAILPPGGFIGLGLMIAGIVAFMRMDIQGDPDILGEAVQPLRDVEALLRRVNGADRWGTIWIFVDFVNLPGTQNFQKRLRLRIRVSV